MIRSIFPVRNNDCRAVMAGAVLSQEFNAAPLKKNINFCRQDPEQIESTITPFLKRTSNFL